MAEGIGEPSSRDTSTLWTVTDDGSLRATYGTGDHAVVATLWGSDPVLGGPVALVLGRGDAVLHRSEHRHSVSALAHAEEVGPALVDHARGLAAARKGQDPGALPDAEFLALSAAWWDGYSQGQDEREAGDSQAHARAAGR